ncbi:MAG: exonuclease domain-containing protein [Firmicutes bacterium]|nr:exonuclease domain-containing protein [Bacillota bacterium]
MTPIIIDLEWNQPLKGRTPVEGLPDEIIQIGAAKIDLEGNVLDTFSQIVKPFYYTKLNKDVAELTLLTDEDLQTGLPFVQAMDAFRAWCGEDCVFLSWSATDGFVMARNCEKFGYGTGWMPKIFDAQLMFDDYEMQEDRSWPLNYALYHFQEKPDGAHNALADVLSTALVLKHLDLAEALEDEYFLCWPREAEDDD